MVRLQPQKVSVAFYRTSMGTEPVRDWIKSCTRADRRVIGSDIATVEDGWPVGMPVCRPLGDGLFELRSNIKDGIARVLFCFHDGMLVLLRSFVKKTRKTPVEEIALARKRKKEIEK